MRKEWSKRGWEGGGVGCCKIKEARGNHERGREGAKKTHREWEGVRMQRERKQEDRERDMEPTEKREVDGERMAKEEKEERGWGDFLL